MMIEADKDKKAPKVDVAAASAENARRASSSSGEAHRLDAAEALYTLELPCVYKCRKHFHSVNGAGRVLCRDVRMEYLKLTAV